MSTTGGKIKNIYLNMPKKYLNKASNPNFEKHQFNIPFYCVVVAPSGSGKTNFTFNLIECFCEGKGTFASITIVTRNKNEPLYNYLQEKCPGISIFEGMNNLPDLDAFDNTENHLVIVDDLVLNKNQTTICDYYIRARKQNCSVMYLSQSYYDVPKLIRKNCRYLVILKLHGNRDIKLILSECGLGLTKNQLFKMYEYATSEDLQPFIIDLDGKKNDKMFRAGLLEYLDPANYN